jgi:hypothetical protein
MTFSMWIAGHLDPAGHLRVQRSLRGRQAAERVQQLRSEVRLYLLELCFRADRGEPRAPALVLPPGHVDLIREVRRDTRPSGCRSSTVNALSGGDCRGGGADDSASRTTGGGAKHHRQSLMRWRRQFRNARAFISGSGATLSPRLPAE